MGGLYGSFIEYNNYSSLKKAESYFSEAFKLNQEEKYFAAIKKFELAIKYNPKYAKEYSYYSALYNEGLTDYLIGQSDDAIEYFNRSLQIKKDNILINLFLSELYFNKKDYLKSLENIKIYKSKIYVLNNDAKELYILSLLNLEKEDLAVSEASQWIRDNLKDEFAYSLRSMAKFRKFDFYGAIEDGLKTISLDKKNPQAYRIIGQSLVAKNIDIYDRGFRRKSAYKYYYTTDENYFAPKKETNEKYLQADRDFREAIQYLNKSIELKSPNLNEAYLFLGIAKLALGQSENGCLDLSKAGELGNKFSYTIIENHCY